MKHTTHDLEIMAEVLKRCKAKFSYGHPIKDVEWNLMYDAVLCDNIIDTLNWKLRYMTIGAKQ